MTKLLLRFAENLLKERLENKGFMRKDMAWLKVVSDVILCVQIRKLRYNGFDMTFGIVPFVCFKAFELELGCFQSEGAYCREFQEENKRFYIQLNGEPKNVSSSFFWNVDSTVFALKDDYKYEILLKYWNDVFEKTIMPFIFKTHDLLSAVDAIGDYIEFSGVYDNELGRIVHKRAYWPTHIPVLLQVNRCEEAIEIIERRYDTAYIDEKANEAAKSKRFNSPFLLYRLAKNNDMITVHKMLDLLQQEALSWIEKNKLHLASTIVACKKTMN